ncbi:MAG TPA: PH domain-containing protein [Candidatus Mediterraneibacter pullistercoris]|nr:PH domain-containing protein [Candidatus Mediterraneibacter pullistercoris]
MNKKNTGRERKFRNHISIILEQTGAAAAALAVLVITALFQNMDEISDTDLSFITGKGFLIFLGVAAILAVSLISQVLIWARTYISIEENAIVIEKGRINKKKNTIGIHNISNINLEQNIFEMLFGTCKVKLDTNSLSTADSTDVKIVLKKPDALWFQQEITRILETYSETGTAAGTCGAGPEYRSSPDADETLDTGGDYDVRADIGDIFQHGAFSVNLISVFVFLLALVGTVISAAEMLGHADLMKSVTGAAAGILVAAFIVVSTLWDTVKDFVRYFGFRAKRRGDKIRIRYGFFKKVEYTIPVDKIQALIVRQSFLARIGRRYMAEIVNVGMGDDKEERNSFLVLYCTEAELRKRLHILLPEFELSAEQKTDPLPASVWAAWAFPAAVWTICVGAAAVLFNELTGGEFRTHVLAGAAALILLPLLVLVLKYRTAGMGADERFLKLVRGYFAKQYLSVRYCDIQYAEFSQNIIARACGLKKGEIHLLASSANTVHTIPYFRGDKDELIKKEMLRY